MEDRKYKKLLNSCSNRLHPNFDGEERFNLTHGQIKEIIDEELELMKKDITSLHTHKKNCSCINTAISLTVIDKDKEWSQRIKKAIELLDIGTSSKTGEELSLAVFEAKKELSKNLEAH